MHVYFHACIDRFVTKLKKCSAEFTPSNLNREKNKAFFFSTAVCRLFIRLRLSYNKMEPRTKKMHIIFSSTTYFIFICTKKYIHIHLHIRIWRKNNRLVVNQNVTWRRRFWRFFFYFFFWMLHYKCMFHLDDKEWERDQEKSKKKSNMKI